MKKAILCMLIVLSLLLIGCGESAQAEKLQEKIALANKYILEQNYEQAILAFQEVIKIDPKAIESYVGLSAVYMLQENNEEAEKILKEGINVATDKNALKVHLAGVYIYQEKYNEAEGTYLEILKADDKYQLAYEGLAQVYQAQEQIEKMIEILEKATKVNSDLSKNYSLLAQAYFQNNQKERALELVKRSLEIDVNNYDAFEALGNIYGSNWHELITYGREMLANNSQDKVGQMFTFYGLINTGQYEEAIKMYENAKDLRNEKTIILTALAYSRLGDQTKANEVLSQIQINNIDHSNILKDLIKYFKETGKKNQAIELAKKGLERNKNYLDFYLILYELTSEEQYLIQLKTLGGNLDQVFYALGLKELKKVKNWDKAIENFTKAINLNNSKPEYYFQRGHAYREKTYERYAEGVTNTDLYEPRLEDFLTAFEKGLVNAESYYAIGRAYHSLGQYELALSYNTKALELNPSHSQYYESQSSTLNMQGRYTEAIEVAKTGLEKAVDPKRKNYLYTRLGDAYSRLGEIDKALDAYMKSLEFTEDNQGKASIYHRISNIQNNQQLKKDDLLKARDLAEYDYYKKQIDEELKRLN